MTEGTESLLVEIPRKLQGNMTDMRREMHEGFAQTNVQIAAMGQRLAALTTAVDAGHDRYNELERPIERIERRLDLREEQG